MAVCSSCRAENPDGARFCASCGSPLTAAACASCGAGLPEGARFCPSCGVPVAATGTGNGARGEERKVVSVLFADLVGFTGRAERLDPEDIRATLSPYASRLRTELERFGGTVEKFVGDAVMALFGAPVAREDDPERAVRAAFAIRDAVAEMNDSGVPIELHVRIAVMTGEALVALDARPEEGEGMAAGDVVNTASRLQSAAPVDGILVGEPTYRATRDAIEYREAEPVHAKGKVEPVRVWEALAVRPLLDLELEERRGPLVGRTEELGLLRESLGRARRERAPQLVTLVGVPGIGKSRLVAELAAAVEEDPERIHWRQGRSLPYGDGVTFWALSEMAKAEAGIMHSDGTGIAAAKLSAAVHALCTDDGEGRWIESHLRPLIGLDGDLGPGSREEEFAAWRRFFEAMAEKHPLVLVFEDLHWADEALLDFVDQLVDRAVGVPLLVVATARADLFERRPDWGGGKRNAATVSLSPLSDVETARLLGGLLEQAVLPAEVQAELLAVVGGVPLCAEEYVRMLEDRGLLRAGQFTAGARLPLPETVQGIIAARLDALPPEEKAIVRDASVIGRSVWIGALQAIGGRGVRELEELLHGLERKELLRRERRSAVANESQYVFWHVLVRDVAYAQIPRAQRAEKHRLAAEWIERLGADRTDDRSEMLAHHYLAALEFARAAGQGTEQLQLRARVALREAGDRATALYAFPAAARFYASAVELWPEGDVAGQQLRLRYGRALIRAEGRGADIVEQARDALLAAGEREAAAEADVTLADVAWMEGRRDVSMQGFRRATALLQDAPLSAAKAYVTSRFAGFLMADGQEEEAIRVGAAALEMTEDLGLDDLSANTLASIGVARTSLGDSGGLDDLARSLEVALGAGSPAIARSHFNLGSTYANLGDLTRAFHHHARGAEAARRFGEPSVERWFEAEALYERYWRGDWDGALAAAAELTAGVGADSGNWALLDAGLVRAAILLARGDVEAAAVETDRALGFARTVEAPQALLPVLPAAARVALAAGDRQAASMLLAELLEAWPTSGILSGFWVADVAVLAVALDEREQFAAAAGRVRAQTRWLEAASAFVCGDPAAAAAIYAAIGSLPDEAYARLRAAGLHLAAGRAAEADAELGRALGFYREARAGLYVREGEALVRTSA